MTGNRWHNRCRHRQRDVDGLGPDDSTSVFSLDSDGTDTRCGCLDLLSQRYRRCPAAGCACVAVDGTRGTAETVRDVVSESRRRPGQVDGDCTAHCHGGR